MGMGWRDIRQGVSGLESVVGPPNQHEVQRAHVARSAQNNIVCLQSCVDSTFNIALEPGPTATRPATMLWVSWLQRAAAGAGAWWGAVSVTDA